MPSIKSDLIFRLRPEEYIRLPEAAKCEKETRILLEKLSNGKLQFEPTNPTVENPNVVNIPFEEKANRLDYNVNYKGKNIATFDVVCANYSFDGEKPSGDFPVRGYKGDVVKKSEVPSFFVYRLTLEVNCTEEERYWWIEGEKILEYPYRWSFIRGKNQDNYWVDKHVWHRGLQTLVDELFKIVERSKQTTLG